MGFPRTISKKILNDFVSDYNLQAVTTVRRLQAQRCGIACASHEFKLQTRGEFEENMGESETLV